jgi:hypothetical protein
MSTQSISTKLAAFAILVGVGLKGFRLAPGVFLVAASFALTYELVQAALVHWILQAWASLKPGQPVRAELDGSKHIGLLIAAKLLGFSLILGPLSYIFLGGEGAAFWLGTVFTYLVLPVMAYELVSLLLRAMLSACFRTMHR